MKDQKSIEYYLNANQDMKFQNLLIHDYQILDVQLEESKLVENAFIHIQRLLKFELDKK